MERCNGKLTVSILIHLAVCTLVINRQNINGSQKSVFQNCALGTNFDGIFLELFYSAVKRFLPPSCFFYFFAYLSQYGNLS